MFKPPTIIPPLFSEYVSQLEQAHEILLDLTSQHILKEQEDLASELPDLVLSDFELASFVTTSYTDRPPNKPACRRAGPFQAVGGEVNVFQLHNLKNHVVKLFEISRLAQFIVRSGFGVCDVAARANRSPSRF